MSKSEVMMKKMIFFCSLLAINLLFSQTADDLSSRLVIDGFSAEFTDYECVIVDSSGNSLESESDSRWGQYNDIRQIKVTWDANNLYLAVDACSWGNNVILFLDIYDDYGIDKMNDLNTWKRSFYFYNQNPDFFLATWDTNSNPQFWVMEEGSNLTANEYGSIEKAASFDTGNLNRSMEAAIPWEVLYYGGSDGSRTMQNYPSIKLVALITGGDDNTSGPDAAPDNLGGMAEDSGQLLVIDNYIEIIVDKDGDDSPDMEVNPNDWDRISYFKKPPIKATALSIKKINFLNGKVLNPFDETRSFQFEIEVNRDSQFDAAIFDIHGKHIRNLNTVPGEPYRWSWNGKNRNGKLVPFGFYIVRISAESGEVTKTEAFSVIK
jgi:hypothetical protein